MSKYRFLLVCCCVSGAVDADIMLITQKLDWVRQTVTVAQRKNKSGTPENIRDVGPILGDISKRVEDVIFTWNRVKENIKDSPVQDTKINVDNSHAAKVNNGYLTHISICLVIAVLIIIALVSNYIQCKILNFIAVIGSDINSALDLA